MSIRQTMQQLAGDAREEIQSLELQIEATNRTKRILQMALNVLSGEPRAETKTALLLNCTQRSMFVDQAECGECKGTFAGWRPDFRFCPLCGSRVTSTHKENDPGDRLAREAVKQAVEQLALAR